MNRTDSNRRTFIDAVGKTGAGLIIGATAAGIAGAQDKKGKTEGKIGEKPEDVGPTEDLMREHGVLNRVLLVYDHFIYQIDQKQDYKPELVTGAASIIRSFVEDYHERQEEQFLFPRFEKARVLADLVAVLKTQHQAGRKLTDQVMSLAKDRGANDRASLAQTLRQFVRMYRPHEAREDTVLFPELRKIVSAHEFDALGEQFEANEHKQFGADGFELYRDKVTGLEKQLGIYDLAQFTPKI
ncbi:MAG: hemerythrin domain-containing protein [Nitrospirota bacterium]